MAVDTFAIFGCLRACPPPIQLDRRVPDQRTGLLFPTRGGNHVSQRWITWAFETPMPSQACKLTALYLACYANDEGLAWLPVALIAQGTGLSAGQVRRAVKILEANNILKVDRSTGWASEYQFFTHSDINFSVDNPRAGRRMGDMSRKWQADRVPT